MILEIATLTIRADQTSEFEAALVEASPLIASIPGYISHALQRCLEVPNRYVLLVKWKTLEAHTVNFRQSPVYEKWRGMLNHFYEAPVVVEHFKLILSHP